MNWANQLIFLEFDKQKINGSLHGNMGHLRTDLRRKFEND